MTTEERFDRIEKVLTALAEAQVKTEDNVDRITAALGQLAETVASHDRQIDTLVRQWQAYLTTIRPRQ
jgi:hypothetical protein